MSMKDELDAVLALSKGPLNTPKQCSDMAWTLRTFLRAHGARLRAAVENDARYRFIRDVPWHGTGTPLERVIAQQRNAYWDSSIDAARASENKTP